MSTAEFVAFPKIARLNRDMVITEKIDGTNSAVIVTEPDDTGTITVASQSRNRLITPTTDNFGFAAWVHANAESLAATLGVGHHFGEWWGAGIQRTYGLSDRRFSLFNVARWAQADLSRVPGLAVVPIIHAGLFDTRVAVRALDSLTRSGSLAAPGFMEPEGIVVYHVAADQLFKATIKGDESWKGARP